MPENNKNNEPTPIDLADVVKNPENYDEQTRVKAIKMITEGAEELLDDIDAETIAAIKAGSEGSSVVDLKKIRDKINKIKE